MTHTNLGEDFSGVHARMDHELASIRRVGVGRTHSASIAGEDVGGNDTYDVTSPTDLELVLGRFVQGDAAQVDRAVAAARACDGALAAAGLGGEGRGAAPGGGRA